MAWEEGGWIPGRFLTYSEVMLITVLTLEALTSVEFLFEVKIVILSSQSFIFRSSVLWARLTNAWKICEWGHSSCPADETCQFKEKYTIPILSQFTVQPSNITYFCRSGTRRKPWLNRWLFCLSVYLLSEISLWWIISEDALPLLPGSLKATTARVKPSRFMS